METVDAPEPVAPHSSSSSLPARQAKCSTVFAQPEPSHSTVSTAVPSEQVVTVSTPPGRALSARMIVTAVLPICELWGTKESPGQPPEANAPTPVEAASVTVDEAELPVRVTDGAGHTLSGSDAAEEGVGVLLGVCEGLLVWEGVRVTEAEGVAVWVEERVAVADDEGVSVREGVTVSVGVCVCDDEGVEV